MNCEFIFVQNISRRELAEIIDEVDTDGSGDISFEEFLDIMKKRKYQNFEEEELRVSQDRLNSLEIGSKIVNLFFETTSNL